MRLMLASLILALNVTALPPAIADQDANSKHPEVQKVDAQQEKIKRREHLLMLFPAGALVLTVALIVITRRKKK